MLKAVAGLLLLTSLAGCQALQQKTYAFTVDPTAKDAHGSPAYVSDADIVAKIPQLSVIGNRINTCMSGMTFPELLYITFPPTVTGAHTALSNHVNCEKFRESTQLTCHSRLADGPVVFDQDPAQYFTLGAGTNIDDALRVFRASHDGRIDFAPGVKPLIPGLKINEISADGRYFILGQGDCGCSETLKVESRDAGRSYLVVASRALCT